MYAFKMDYDRPWPSAHAPQFLYRALSRKEQKKLIMIEEPYGIVCISKTKMEKSVVLTAHMKYTEL